MYPFRQINWDLMQNQSMSIKNQYCFNKCGQSPSQNGLVLTYTNFLGSVLDNYFQNLVNQTRKSNNNSLSRIGSCKRTSKTWIFIVVTVLCILYLFRGIFSLFWISRSYQCFTIILVTTFVQFVELCIIPVVGFLSMRHPSFSVTTGTFVFWTRGRGNTLFIST